MKRKFYVYKYGNGNIIPENIIHKNIINYISIYNKSLARITPKESNRNYNYVVSTVLFPDELFFVGSRSRHRPIYVKNPLLTIFEGEDNSAFPKNENMDSLRKADSIVTIRGPLDLEKYSIIINLNIEGLIC